MCFIHARSKHLHFYILPSKELGHAPFILVADEPALKQAKILSILLKHIPICVE